MNIQEFNTYINIDITNNNNNYQTINFNCEIDTNIFSDPNEKYMVAVSRFLLPISMVPILVFKDDYYYVTLSNKLGPTQNFTETLLYSGNNIFNGEKYIYSYQEFLYSLNNALSQAFNNLKVAFPLYASTVPPRITYDAKTKLFSLTVEPSYFSEIDIFFNIPLYELFQNFEYQMITFNIVPDKKNVQFVLRNNYNNFVSPNYVFVQELPSLDKWNSAKKIALYSDTLNIDNEFLQQTSISPEAQNERIDNSEQIITDYVLDFNSDINYVSYIPYFYRWHNILNTMINSINIKCYWIDKQNKKRELYICNGEYASIKLIFRKI